MATALVVIAIAASLLTPLGVGSEDSAQSAALLPDAQSIAKLSQMPSIDSIVFPSPVNTSTAVDEYPSVARALMLSGGSTYSTLADINRDGRTDLIVAVSDAKLISIFYRQSDGNFLSYPSANITLGRTPIGVAVIDAYSNGNLSLVVVERRSSDSDTERLLILNSSSETSFSEFQNLSLYKTAGSFAIGRLNSDIYPDIAFVCPGLTPSSTKGVVDILLGPDYTMSIQFNAGKGANCVAVGDFNSDGSLDIVVSNYYDGIAAVFFQPFSFGNAPNYNLTTSGMPLSLIAGNLNSDTLDDIAVVTENPSSLSFFFQSLGNLQTYPDDISSRDFSWEAPSSVFAGDMNRDDRTDLVMLSDSENLAFGLLQGASGDVWRMSTDFVFPTGATPRHALIGDLDPDSMPDLAISTARSDWSGSSISIYPSRLPVYPPYSNSNRTYLGNMSSAASKMALGDLNGDGTQEIVLLYPSINALELVSTSTGLGYNKSLGFTPADLIVSDFNEDGLGDILLSKSGSNELEVSLGVSDLSAPFAFAQLTCGGTVTSLAEGDFNNDSMFDIVAATDNGKLDIFFNTGFASAPFGSLYEIVPAPGVEIPAVAVGDYNSDGLDDIAYSLPSLNINISFQKPSSPFILAAADTVLFHTTGGIFSSLWSGDLNGDGKTDIAAMRSADTQVYLFDHDDFLTSRTPYSAFAFPDIPRFAAVMDVTDDGHSDVVSAFDSADLLVLYKQQGGMLPTDPSMIFVTGALPKYAIVGEIGADHKHALLTSDSESHTVSAWEQVNVAPVVDAGGPYSASEGTPIEFVGSALDSVSQIPYLLYQWDFGDGNVTGWTANNSVLYTYSEEGFFTATMAVKDPGGLVSPDTASVTIGDSSPAVDFAWSPSNPVEGQVITLTDTTWSFDTVLLINWTVNGLLVSSGLEHTLQLTLQNGSYNISLEETDNDGSVGIVYETITVLRSPPQVTIAAVSAATEDDVVSFTALVDPWHSGLGDNIETYEWNFSYAGSFVIDKPTFENTATWVFDSPIDSTKFTVVVRVTDNDGDQSLGFFNITIFDRTKVHLQVSSADPLFEFDAVNLTAIVDASHPATLFEWQFDADPSGPFTAEVPTLTADISHVFGVAKTFLVKVNVTVSNGSWAIDSRYVTIHDVVLTGTFDEFVTWTRNPDRTSEITFNATNLTARYSDIARTSWEFGDGDVTNAFGGPDDVVVHDYTPDRDYNFVLNITDNDNNRLLLTKTLKLNATSILLVSPANNSVIQPGTSIRLVFSDDSPPLLWVKYSINGGPLTEFTIQWEIATDAWLDGDYALVIKVADRDGNIAVRSDIVITVDNQPPVVTIVWTAERVYGGSVINITVNVSEPHIDPSEIILFVKFPGATSPSQVRMSPAGGGTGIYFAIIEVPKRAGTIEFYVTAADMAENTVTTSTHSVVVKLHFIDVAWPFLLGLAVLAALGTAGYFVRESKIAVDETFVIYNDGRLIAHTTRHLKPGMDDQVLGGMFVAIQDFVKDSFKDITSFTLRKLEFGEKSVLIEKGDHLFLAVILHGKASKKVASKMEMIVDEIEEQFSHTLKDWDGDLDALRGVGDIAKKLYSKAPLLPAFRRQET